MLANWKRTALVHNAGTLRNTWICVSCSGVKCEIMLPLNAEPEHCLKKEVADGEAVADAEVYVVRED